MTVTSEQAVLSYDAAHPGQPLAARYPTGPSAALGTPELDYPYVVTSTDPAERDRGAASSGTLLQQGYTAALVRTTASGRPTGPPGPCPRATGWPSRPLQLAAARVAQRGPDGAGGLAPAADRLAGPGADGRLVVDGRCRPGCPALTLEQELTQTATLGLALFPDSTQMGMWDFADHLEREPALQAAGLGRPAAGRDRADQQAPAARSRSTCRCARRPTPRPR